MYTWSTQGASTATKMFASASSFPARSILPTHYVISEENNVFLII